MVVLLFFLPGYGADTLRLKAPVEFGCRDSARFVVEDSLLVLYGDAYLRYGQLHVYAPVIRVSWSDYVVEAHSRSDTAREVILVQEGDTFRLVRAKYNMETQKGKIWDIAFREGEVILYGRAVKRLPENIIYVTQGRFTTCMEEPPHFYVGVGKLKVVPRKVSVSGPAVVYLNDLVVPVALPFGIFPIYPKAHSGFIVPAVGESPTLGFFLRDGGYYLALNDYVHAGFLGDVYSRGAWRATLQLKWRRRYRHSGYLQVSYSHTYTDNPLRTGAVPVRDFFIAGSMRSERAWLSSTHLRADISFGTGTYLLNNEVDYQRQLRNTLQSGIFVEQAVGRRAHASINVTSVQNTITRTTTMDIPAVSFSVQPTSIKLGSKPSSSLLTLSYTARLLNRLSGADTQLLGFISNSERTFPPPQLIQAFQQRATANLNWTYLRFVMQNLVFSATHWLYPWRLERRLDPFTGTLHTDTITGLFSPVALVVSTNFSTTLYGLFRFAGGAFQLRHIVRPSVALEWQPDYSRSPFGYSGVIQVDSARTQQRYSFWEGAVMGAPPMQEVALLSFAVSNTLEGKNSTKEQQERRFTPVEDLTVRGGYSFSADSIRWQPLQVSVRTSGELVKVVASGVWNLYSINEQGVPVNVLYWQEKGKPLRFVEANVSVDINLRGVLSLYDSSKHSVDPYFRWTGTAPGTVHFLSPHFSLNIQHTLSLRGTAAPPLQNTTLYATLSPVSRWYVTIRLAYDYSLHALSYLSLTVTRDLHCWELRVEVVPVGPRQWYMAVVRAKAPVLEDVKLQRRKYWFDK